MKYSRHNALSESEIEYRLNHCLETVSDVYDEDKEHIQKTYRKNRTYYEMKQFFIFCAIDVYAIPTRAVTDFIKLDYATVILYANAIRDSYDRRHRKLIKDVYEIINADQNLKIIKWKSVNRLSKKDQANLYA